MFQYGYCSECTEQVALVDVGEHNQLLHPGLLIWLNLYRPDRPGMATKLDDAIAALERVARAGEQDHPAEPGPGSRP